MAFACTKDVPKECEKINAHFFRNFITLGEDIMLDAFADTSYTVIGFQRDHKKQDFSDPQEYNWGKEITGFKPVSEIFRQEAIEDQKKKKEEEERKKLGLDETGKDNSAKISAYIAVVIAGVSTLCF